MSGGHIVSPLPRVVFLLVVSPSLRCSPPPPPCCLAPAIYILSSRPSSLSSCLSSSCSSHPCSSSTSSRPSGSMSSHPSGSCTSCSPCPSSGGWSSSRRYWMRFAGWTSLVGIGHHWVGSVWIGCRWWDSRGLVVVGVDSPTLG